MEADSDLKQELRKALVENLMLQVQPSEIRDDQPLFGPEGLGLDSVDALQLVVVLDKQYGLKIPDPEAARRILQNVETIAQAIAETSQSAGTSETTPPAPRDSGG